MITIVEYTAGLNIIWDAMDYIKTKGGKSYLFDDDKMAALELLSERAGYVFDAIEAQKKGCSMVA